MRIAICEDDSYFLNYSSKIIQACFAAYQPDCVIDSFSDSSILFKTLTSHNLYDVLFLDIDMPQIDGITIGSFLKKAEADAFIIYLSGREDLVFDTFETRPFSFLPKNQFQQKIRSTVASVCIACQQKQTLVSFFIGGTHYQWDLKKLVYIECCNKTNSQPPLQVVVCVSPHKGYITARPKGRYRKLCHWSAIKRYSWNLLFLIPQPALLYISALLHL